MENTKTKTMKTTKTEIKNLFDNFTDSLNILSYSHIGSFFNKSKDGERVIYNIDESKFKQNEIIRNYYFNLLMNHLILNYEFDSINKKLLKLNSKKSK